LQTIKQNNFKPEFLDFLTSININYTESNNIVKLTNHSYSFKLNCIDKDLSPANFRSLRKVEIENNSKFLILIWEDLWSTKRNVIESKIKHLVNQSIKIHARQTKVKEISALESESFLSKNHLFEPSKGFKRLALIKNEAIVAVAVFAKRRKFRDGSYSSELIMFSTLNYHHVNGGLTKLISRFKIDYPIKTLMTYIDLDWSEGAKFEKVGFKLHGFNQPKYYYPANLSTNRVQIVENNQDETAIFNMGSAKFILTFES
jgi:hypothetical protein